jgi:hypothetical protein
LARLPAGLFAAGRFGGDPAALARRITYLLSPPQAARLQRAKLDPVRDLAAYLSPGGAAGLWLAPTFDMAAVSGGVAAAARDPFRLVHVAGIQRVRDGERLRAGLDRLARAGPSLGLRIASRALPGGAATWSTRVGGGQVAWALDGQRLFFAGGAGRLEALRAGGEGWKPPTAAARAALSSGGAAAVLDLGALVRDFGALPPEAFGTGPDGFVLRALADRFLEPASHLVAASLRLEVLAAAARIDLEIEARSP